MKALILMVLTFVCAIPADFFAQEVKMTDETVQFSTGIHNAIVVTIPFGKREVVEAQLKSELKRWKGNLTISGDEYKVIQGQLKAMGENRHDTYAKIIETVDEIKVAFAVDLGGKYMTRSEHPVQYKHIYERVKLFGAKAGSASLEKDMDSDKKVLKLMEKEEKKLQKEIASSKKDIEDYQKKIEESQKNVEAKQAELLTKQEEIKTQNLLIAERKKTAKKIK